jgi:hypothetical protein
LAYGTKITNYTYESTDVEKIDGYEGRWVKAFTTDGKQGYIYDGYTLPFRPPNDQEGFADYLKSIAGPVIFVDSIVPNGINDDYDRKYITHYKSGMIFIEANMYEAYECSLLNLEISIYQGYLLYYLMEEKLWGRNHLVDKINFPVKNIDSDTLTISVDPTYGHGIEINRIEGSFSYLKVFYQNGSITLCWGSYI